MEQEAWRSVFRLLASGLGESIPKQRPSLAESPGLSPRISAPCWSFLFLSSTRPENESKAWELICKGKKTWAAKPVCHI